MNTPAKTYHKLLLRQIKKHFGSLDAIPADVQIFVDAVNEAYHQADADRALLERSLELSSQELTERYKRLQEELVEREQKDQALHLAEEERVRLQEEIIRVQAATLEQLSTPLIPINDNVVVMPLIGTMDSRRTQQVLETLLQGLSDSQANIAILDITGVGVVDTQVAQGLIHAAQAAQLLGAQVMLTGIRPEIAQTLVGLGVDLRTIVTHSTLQNGIAAVMK
ncbi:MAG: RsbR, positive regulator of sigma-B [Chloroflexi bacterium AL-W]|nr:RsbR, positive regulator of sigma-B [Chloroflexi bacterium AL-N1]NOK69369.1 RsbR, positive regulator of sigma-B [Chloroflexi bacterium AL-N10]NOK76430.1 RsbR, positive regulator of sigma-B [Chloroflexi bacterium AL-N5]NOK83547.1 RsbR, positive regulator of sigma-B [Chloroflexi bacterium AL-W]NOK91207.1 RsbR, positive regulator of sigma-B [Chloroflexi bacterium AL-N15]